MTTKKAPQFFRIYPENEKIKSRLSMLDLFKKHAVLSIGDIEKKAGISEAIAAEYINSCVKEDLLRISGSEKDGLVEFSDDHRNVLGVGFTDEKCILTVMGTGGGIITTEQIDIDPLSKMKGRKKELTAIVEKISEGTDLKKGVFCLAGIAIPESVCEKTSKAPDVLTSGLKKIFGCTVLAGTSATCAAYAEREFGEQASLKDILYLHEDIGIGVSIKNELIFEAKTNARRKDVSYLDSWKQFSMVDTAKSLVSKGVGTNIVTLVNGDVDSITMGTVLSAAEDNDEVAIDLVRRSGLALGVRVAYLINMFSPEIVVLGGGIERRDGSFLRLVTESAEKFLYMEKKTKVEIIPGETGEESTSVGAAALCRRELFMEV